MGEAISTGEVKLHVAAKIDAVAQPGGSVGGGPSGGLARRR
jgi:hypothetical protein